LKALLEKALAFYSDEEEGKLKEFGVFKTTLEKTDA